MFTSPGFTLLEMLVQRWFGFEVAALLNFLKLFT